MGIFDKFCKEAWDEIDIEDYNLDVTALEIRKDVFKVVYDRLENYLTKHNKK